MNCEYYSGQRVIFNSYGSFRDDKPEVKGTIIGEAYQANGGMVYTMKFDEDLFSIFDIYSVSHFNPDDMVGVSHEKFLRPADESDDNEFYIKAAALENAFAIM